MDASEINTPGQDSPDLTLKQRKFLAAYFRSGNSTQAAMEAFDCKDRVTAASVGYETLRKLQIPLRLIMEAKGLSSEKLIEVVKEGLNAMHNGLPDYRTRLGYAQMAGKWLGLDTREGDSILLSQRTDSVYISSDSEPFSHEPLAKRIRALIERIKQLESS